MNIYLTLHAYYITHKYRNKHDDSLVSMRIRNVSKVLLNIITDTFNVQINDLCVASR